MAMSTIDAVPAYETRPEKRAEPPPEERIDESAREEAAGPTEPEKADASHDSPRGESEVKEAAVSEQPPEHVVDLFA